MIVVEALKLTKSGKRSKYDLAIVDFYTIELQDVKHLPLSFDNDILLHHAALEIPSAYGWSVDGMDKVIIGKHGTPTPMYKGMKEGYRSTNDVEHEFWVCLDNIKHYMNGNNKKYVLD